MTRRAGKADGAAGSSAAKTPAAPAQRVTAGVIKVASEATVLDVGHGNAAVIRADSLTMVVDAAPGAVLPDELNRTGTTRIEHLVLSHADQDHIGGAAALISGTFALGTLWINTDSMKSSASFDDLRVLAYDAHRHRGLTVRTQLDNTIGNALDIGDIQVEVIHPNLLSTITGPRGSKHRGREVTANQMSVVLRLSSAGQGHLLLTGDIDAKGLAELLASGADVQSRVLVYPHHGGHSGQDDAAFARRLVEAVKPDMVIFSHGRSRYDNPRPEVVAAIRAVAPDLRIVCTQLSTHCSSEIALSTAHLIDRPAAGRNTGSCCAGTITIALAPDSIEPSSLVHQQFIETNAPSALCKTMQAMPVGSTQSGQKAKFGIPAQRVGAPRPVS